MPVTHEPWLVALSVILAIQGSYVGLNLAIKGVDAHGPRRRLMLASAAISLALAIWTMHFVGMLAARVPFPVDYLVVPTLLSFLVCVIVVGAGVLAVSIGPTTAARLVAAAVFMGLGIASMHYVGMQAIHASAHMEHSPPLVMASIAIAIATSGLALWLAIGRPVHSLLFSATALGLAISGMHYTAMAGLSLYPHGAAASPAPVLSADLLAIVVAIVAFLVSGGFLLVLIPDPSVPAEAEELPSPGGGEIAPNIKAEVAEAVARASASPLRGPSHIPVARDGRTHFVSIDDIVAVHANAHYTHVFDGTSTLFCPLPIGEIEQRLDPRRFARVHRSHIVNIERITGMKLAGDNGVIELAAHRPYTVPVSRGRLGQVRSRLSAASKAAAFG
jgi:NO-binding membrane sensor protein with MHYT domain